MGKELIVKVKVELLYVTHEHNSSKAQTHCHFYLEVLVKGFAKSHFNGSQTESPCEKVCLINVYL